MFFKSEVLKEENAKLKDKLTICHQEAESFKAEITNLNKELKKWQLRNKTMSQKMPFSKSFKSLPKSGRLHQLKS